MIQFLKITILILLSIFLLSCSGGYEPTKHLTRYPQITLKISLNKSEYVEGEPIWLTAKFKNVGNKADSLADLEDEYAIYHNLKIKSDSGLPVKYYGVIGDKGFPVYTTLKPGQSYDISVNVRQFWMNNYRGTRLFQGYISEGKYDIQSLYLSEWSEDWLEIQSNKLSFRVIKPSKINSEALDSLIDIFKSNRDWAKQLYGFYNIHPKSVYAEEAFYFYTVLRILEKNKTKVDSSFLNECYDFFENYPYSYYRCEVLRRSLWAYQIINGRSPKNYQHYLKFMSLKYPNLTGCADRLIENDNKIRNALIWEKRKIEGIDFNR